MSDEEMRQRRVDTLEWKPDVMTDAERLEWRRIEASYAFEVMTDAEFQRRSA